HAVDEFSPDVNGMPVDGDNFVAHLQTGAVCGIACVHFVDNSGNLRIAEHLAELVALSRRNAQFDAASSTIGRLHLKRKVASRNGFREGVVGLLPSGILNATDGEHAIADA